MADQSNVEFEGTDEMEASSAEDEGGEEETLQKAKQAITCRSVTLITLMDDGVIQPGEGVLSIDYLGQRFEADLLDSGKIKWHGCEHEFNTPSAWALHCKRLVNPIKRSGCGWASVKYKNRKLDMWKSIWARKHRTTSPFKSPHQTTSSVSPTNLPTTSPTSTVSAATKPVSSSPTLSLSMSDSTTVGATTVTTTVDAANFETISGSTCSLATQVSPSSSFCMSIKPVAINFEHLHQNVTPMETDRQTTESSSTSASSLGRQLPATVEKCDQELMDKGTVKDVSPKKISGVTGVEAPLNLSKPLLASAIREETSPKAGKSFVMKESHRSCNEVVLKEKKSVPYSSLGVRTVDMDLNTLVKCEHFDKHSKIQPFTVAVTSNTLLLMDFHCHLTRSEVVGYLGGKWDPQKQHVNVEQSFPVLCRLGDKQRFPLVEEQIRHNMKMRHMVLVGWYHSHPYCQAEPSVRDVDCQMSYQLKMRGTGSTYHPCIGFIEAPYEKVENTTDSAVRSFWVMPNLERPSSYNIPMDISYSTKRDISLTEDILNDMKRISEFYSGSPDKVRLKERWKDGMTYMDKIRGSLSRKLPEDQLDSGTFLDYMQQLLKDMK